jgi:Fe-S-cluster-containing hydrogenase component 2
MCGLACPFGVIISGGTPIPAYGFNTSQYSYINTPYQSEPMHLREMDQENVISLLVWHIGQKKVAIKCDLCFFDREGPACVRACPHRALSLIDGKIDDHSGRIKQMKTVARIRRDEIPQSKPANQGED